MPFWRRRPRPPYAGDCPACGHDWREHLGGAWADPLVPECGECAYERDHGERTGAGCTVPAPA